MDVITIHDASVSGWPEVESSQELFMVKQMSLDIMLSKDPVHVHDFQATVLHQLGLNHEKLIFKHSGRRYRLTDVEGKVVNDILA